MKDKLKENYKNKGLVNKYIITKTNGKKVDPRANYFVLRLDEHQKDPIHRRACLSALLHYADKISNHLPKLSADLYSIYGQALIEKEEERGLKSQNATTSKEHEAKKTK